MARPSKTARPMKTPAMSSTLRCLRVMELLAEEPFELGVSDVAMSLRIPPSSAHRLCATLVKANLVEHDAERRLYRLGPKALWVGSGYLRHSDVYRAAFFAIQDLARSIAGIVQLGVFDEGWVQFIYSLGYPGSTDAFADVGLRRPLHATASGKLFLSAMTDREVERAMGKTPQRFTDRTIISLAEMTKELAEIRANGCAVNNQELLPGYVVIAAPMYNRTNTIAATISTTIPVDEFNRDDESRARILRLVKEASVRASIQLGHRPLKTPSR